MEPSPQKRSHTSPALSAREETGERARGGILFDEGEHIGPYKVLAHLKTGGMAELYLAQRKGVRGFSRPVAIKVIHPRLMNSERFTTMFVNEALLSVRISHPNVVHVEELGEARDTYYLAMEYVHGLSLSQLIRNLVKSKQRLTQVTAVAIALRIAEGLHAAHETIDAQGNPLNVVHRDVSPQNIILSTQGHVKVIDFGIAKAKHHTEVKSKGLKGKIRYMAPEQVVGGEIDRRTDVYALGIVLWEMLTMRRLFHGDGEFDIMTKVRDAEVVSPRRYCPDLDPQLEAVVMRALSRHPDARPSSARELRRELAEVCPKALALDTVHMARLVLSSGGAAFEAVHAAAFGELQPPALPPSVSEIELTSFSVEEDLSAHLDVDGAPLPIPRRENPLADGDSNESSASDVKAKRPALAVTRRAAPSMPHIPVDIVDEDAESQDVMPTVRVDLDSLAQHLNSAEMQHMMEGALPAAVPAPASGPTASSAAARATSSSHPRLPREVVGGAAHLGETGTHAVTAMPRRGLGRALVLSMLVLGTGLCAYAFSLTKEAAQARVAVFEMAQWAGLDLERALGSGPQVPAGGEVTQLQSAVTQAEAPALTPTEESAVNQARTPALEPDIEADPSEDNATTVGDAVQLDEPTSAEDLASEEVDGHAVETTEDAPDVETATAPSVRKAKKQRVRRAARIKRRRAAAQRRRARQAAIAGAKPPAAQAPSTQRDTAPTGRVDGVPMLRELDF